MEAICSSETSVETRRTTRRHTPENNTLYFDCINILVSISDASMNHFITTYVEIRMFKHIKYFFIVLGTPDDDNGQQ
jgi:hypothetical protein